MARPLRIEFPGAMYHVIVRGNERKAVFRDDADREDYLRRLAGYGGREGVSHARWQDSRMEAWLARYGLSFLERCITSSCEEMSARRFSGTTPIGRTTYGGWRATVRSSAFACWRTA